MPDYELTVDAEKDLREIARYTTKSWGADQARQYKADLVLGFKGIAAGTVHTRTPFTHRPDIRSYRCGHHYVFSVHERDAKPVIVAVLHENMDLVSRLSTRLAVQ